MIHPVVVNPVLSPVVRVTDPVRWRAGKLAPDGAILHYDADLDAFAEQTGGPHAFNHAVLSPQYQRNANGSYTDVGAKPAVDTFDGERWLRSCGAITNLLPSGYNDMTLASWTKRGTCTVGAGNLVSGLQYSGGLGDVYNYATGLTPSARLAVSFRVKRVSKTGSLYIQNPRADGTGRFIVNLALLSDEWEWINENHPSVAGFIEWNVGLNGEAGFLIKSNATSEPYTSVYIDSLQQAYSPYPVPYVPPGVTQPASNATTTNGSWFSLPNGSPLWHALDGGPETDGVELVTNGGFDSADGWALVGSGWQITNGALQASASIASSMRQYISGSAGAYRIRLNYSSTAGDFVIRFSSGNDFDYIAGTKYYSGNGTVSVNVVVPSSFDRVRVYSGASPGFTGSIDNISIQRIQPQPLTLATRVRMGVGSGDVSVTEFYLPIISEKNDTNVTLQRYYKDATTTHIVVAKDGTVTVATGSNIPWPRNSIIRRITQVNTAGTQFRVGYMIEGTHTTIQWRAWMNYDGSFDPSTLYRLMLGYGNPYPMWFNKITAWKEQVSDARILEAMA